MRLPNHYGTVYKLKGKRRKPFVAKKFIGKELDEERRTVRTRYAVLGYFPTRLEALTALAEYNRMPYDLTKAGKTLREVYEAWSAEKFPKLKETDHYTAAFAVLSPIHEERMEDLKLDMVQAVFDSSGKNAPTLKNVRLLMSQLFDFSVIHEYIPQRTNVWKHLNVGDTHPTITRRIFSSDEISKLWEDPHDDLNRLTLILLYTGMRISELLEIRDVDLDKQVMHIHAAKTSAGVRDVPIADKILPLVEEYLSWHRITYTNIRVKMAKRYDHKPHDTRHTFTSMAVEKGIDQRLIDEIIGHTHGNLSLDVYTHIGLPAKLEAVNRL